MAVGDLTAEHLTSWLASKDWSDNTKRTATESIKACLRWAARKFHFEYPVQDVPLAEG